DQGEDIGPSIQTVHAPTVTTLTHSPATPTVGDSTSKTPVAFTANTVAKDITDSTDLDGNADSRWSFLVYNAGGLVPGGAVSNANSNTFTVPLAAGSYVALALFKGHVDVTTLVKDEALTTRYDSSCGRDEVTVAIQVTVPGPTVTETTPG